MNNSVFGKTMENVRKYRDIKLVATDERRNQLVSDPNYCTTNFFQRLVKLCKKEIEKKRIEKKKI